MKITVHNYYLVQLTRWGMVNCYLVREDEGFTLVDTGLSGSERGIVKAAASIGRPITRITLTHSHIDHAGSLDALRSALPAAEFVATERTACFLSGDRGLEDGEPDSKLRGNFVTSTTKPTRIIQPGDRLGSLQVIAAPGHTPDHVAFLDERSGTLIAGDAYQTKGGVAVTGTIRWLFPLPALATWHKPTSAETARKLLDLKPALLAVGHGRVLEDPVPAMERAIKEAAGIVHGQEQMA